jgi:cytosine/uracil/thiamine/allantoin permease
MKFLSRPLLWLATIWSAVWFGGQVFNALMVVPHFSRNPPESLVAWGEMRFDNLADFFVIFAPLWTFAALLVTAVFVKDHPARRWIIFGAVCALVSLMGLLGWMVPTISRLVQSDQTASMDDGELDSDRSRFPHALCDGSCVDFFATRDPSTPGDVGNAAAGRRERIIGAKVRSSAGRRVYS